MTGMAPEAERTFLHGVSWATYESLVSDHVDRSAPRFTYDRGVLEIMRPGFLHETTNRALALVVELIAAEHLLDIVNVGSTTCKREEDHGGFDPDASFYIQNADHIREKLDINLAVDPLPDLVIEINITRTSLPKLPIYARLGVPEVWRFDGERVSISLIADNQYRAVKESIVLPPATSEILTRFVIEHRQRTSTVWMSDVRAWARSHVD